MPIKKDGTGKRWVEMEFITPGTPEQVWQAMATGPGNTAWFTKTTIEERVGGIVRFDFGPDATSTGEVTVWEPPHRFGYVERDWSEAAPPVATEITIHSRSGDRCVVRMVHSLFSSSDDWDDQMEGFESGWPSFFAVLRTYLSRFTGMPAASFLALVKIEGEQLAIWKRLTEALHLAGADAGEHRATAPRPEPLSGVIEQIQQDGKQRVIMMRLEAPLPGVALFGTYGASGRVNASLGMFLYGERAEQVAAASSDTWRIWLAETFPSGDKPSS